MPRGPLEPPVIPPELDERPSEEFLAYIADHWPHVEQEGRPE